MIKTIEIDGRMLPQLWEHRAPFQGPVCDVLEVDDFEDLADQVGMLREGVHPVVRYEWFDAMASIHDTELRDEPGRAEMARHFTVWVAQGREYGAPCVAFRCPIDRDDLDEVWDWLNGPRVLGDLDALWGPLRTQPYNAADWA